MTILVAGLGLVGTNLVERLKGKYKVYGITRRTGTDLRDAKLVNTLVTNLKPDVIYMTAANAAEARGQISPIDMTENNLLIFVNVLRAAINAGVKKFIYTSSVAVYGDAPIPYKEDGPLNPKDVYGVNKLAAEQILKIMAKVYNFEYVIVRPHNIYGAHMNMNNPYKNVVGLFMRRLIEGKPYKLFGGGTMRRAFSYIDDVMDVLEACLTPEFTNKTFNMGGTKDISIKEFSDTLQKVTGITATIEYEPARPQEIHTFLADHDIQASLIHYKDTPLEEGLAKTWEWVKKKELGGLEVMENEIYV